MRRSILAPVISALVFPGGGQFVNRQFVKGALFVAACVGLFAFMYVKTSPLIANDVAGLNTLDIQKLTNVAVRIADRIPFSVRAAFWGIFGLWMCSIVDALLVGRRLDREAGTG